MEIAKRLESEKIVNPTKYYYSIGRKTCNKRSIDPYRWEQATVVHILENKQYTGCTVNFKTTFVSFKVKKTVHLPEKNWQIIPNTQEAIIDEDTFDRVAELRKSRHRNTATGRTSMFAGLLYCADCGSKLYFAAAKSIKEHQEYYSCSNYKSNRGSCTVHYIREVVIKAMVLEAIQKVAKYVVEYEPVFLYLFAKKNTLGRETTIRNMKAKIEKSKRRIKELDIYFTAVGIINIPTEEELIAAMEEMQEKPLKSA